MKKIVKVAVTAVMGAMLMAGAAVASDDVSAPMGKNMTGAGLGQGATKYFISDFLKLDPMDIRIERREGLSMVQISEKNGVPGDVLIDAVIDFRADNMGTECTIEDAKAKITANLNKAPNPRANANPQQVKKGNMTGAVSGDQFKGQARGWQR